MAKKTNGQNPVDEAYLRSLMVGVPSEPSLSPASSLTGENGENRETALSDEKRKADERVNETVKNVSVTDDTSCPEVIAENRHRRRHARHWPTLSADSLPPINAKAGRECISTRNCTRKYRLLSGLRENGS